MLWVTCCVGGDRFVMDARRIAAVLPPVSWKRVVGGPPGIVGLVNYHQTPVPLLDLSMLLFGVPSQLRMHSRILLAQMCSGADGAVLPEQRHDERCDRRLLAIVAEKGVATVRCELGDFVVPDAATKTAPYLGPVFTDARGIVQRIELDALIAPAAYTSAYTDMLASSETAS